MPKPKGCAFTHRWLVTGSCPWCNQYFIEGNAQEQLPGKRTGDRVWNIPEITKAVEKGSEDYCLAAISDLLGDDSDLFLVLPLLAIALNRSDRNTVLFVEHRILMKGRWLTPSEADRLTLLLSQAPNNLVMRLLLLGHSRGKEIIGKACTGLRHAQVMWIISNCPERSVAASPWCTLLPELDGQVYYRARSLWLQHVDLHRANPRVLGNAAHFFLFRESNHSEHYFTLAAELDPTNPEWPRQLAHLYLLGRRRQAPDEQRANANRALLNLSRALQLSDSETDRVELRLGIAWVSLESGDMQRAQVCATTLLRIANGLRLEEPSASSRVIHYSNTILGRIKLANGDISASIDHLYQSAQIESAPITATAGPNMALANELLQIGERSAVIQFLQRCTRFWESSTHTAQQWIHMIENGEIPDFGANLDY